MNLPALIRRYFEKVVAPRYGLILLFCLVVSVVAGWVLVTRWNINSDFKALLPQTAPAALAMTEVSDRIGSGSALFVVIDSPDKEANRKFAKVYSDAMLEKEGVALAHFHNDKSFFEKHQLLYLSVEDLKKLKERIRKRIKDEKKRANPLFIDLKPKKKNADFLKTDDLANEYKNSAQSNYKEYLEADDGYSLTIVVRFVESSTNLVATNKLLDDVKSLGKTLDPTSFHPDMKVEFGGGLVNRQKEYNSILSDVKASAIFTIVGLFLVIGLYFRRLRAVALVLGPLIMGILWTLAIAFLIYGELTTVTAFIFAILLGLGIDFAIHLLSSYDERRAEGLEPIDALVECYTGTGTATVYGALTTFATFVVLGFAQFRGLSQFGVVASIGVLCSLLAMFTALPAGLLAFSKLKHAAPKRKGGVVASAIANKLLSGKVPIASLVVAIFISAFAISNFGDIKFEENFRKIGKVNWPWMNSGELLEEKKDAERWGKGQANRRVKAARRIREAIDPATFEREREQKSVGSKYSNAVGDSQTSTPTIMLFDDAETTRKVYEEMQTRMGVGALPTVKSASAIFGFMPGTAEEQTARMVEIDAIRAVLDKEGTAFLDDKQKKKVAELREKLDVKPITIYDLPEWTKRLFKEAGASAKPAKEGQPFAFEYTIFLNENVDQMVGQDARRFLNQVVALSDETNVDIRIGSQSFIYVAMLDEIQTDGARMMAIAILVVFLLLMLAFRSPLRAFLAFLPLAVGSFWLFGFCAWLGIRFDFFNVIILPVVIGIGIDDGVHFYHRYRELVGETADALKQTWREVGSAVFMTSITSSIGFGGLAITNHFGLRSIGFVAITGIVCTLVATVLVLPAVLWLMEQRGKTSQA